MMQQYLLLKEQYKDVLLFYRLGDFYEMFFEDALVASRELELVLTGRDCGLEERAPMCGVPFHSVNTYINKLLEKNYRVAICEQLTEPTEGKALVERDVVRVITPGTVIEDAMLDNKINNYIVSIYLNDKACGMSWADVSTGEFYVTEINCSEDFTEVINRLSAANANEIIVNDAFFLASAIFPEHIKKQLKPFLTLDNSVFEFTNANAKLCSHFKVKNLNAFDCEKLSWGISAAGALLEYLSQTQKNQLVHMNSLIRYKSQEFMFLDSSTRRNLELFESLNERGKKGSLIWLLDKTKTAMGGRMLRLWLDQPLQSKVEIERRLDAVGELESNYSLREGISELLSQVADIERICTRAAYGTINARDCLAMAKSLSILPALKEELSFCACLALADISARLENLDDIFSLLQRSINEQPPVGVKDGGIIKKGFNEELDELLEYANNGKELVLQLEAREREETGIKTLKVGFNKVFGYYIEISKGAATQAPYRYIRKQTLTNGERYITPELKEMEERILGAEDKSIRLEYVLFCSIREMLVEALPRLQNTAKAIAQLDSLLSLARVAYDYSYAMPTINESGVLNIVDGRHPVVERVLNSSAFVPNSTTLDAEENRFMVITGPNMAGKSTYMRQVALITLLAHIGSFVPAKSANISICDRIFTRVGASDDLASGQSTFMLEMSEVANILHNATKKSLIILDEIGRGTSTFDGLSIAWAVTEYIASKKNIGAKTLFATHYHELSELEGRLEGVKNYCVTVKEYGDEVIFLRKIVRGSADKSFGIAVASLAGLPKEVLERSRDILQRLEEADISKNSISANILANGTAPKSEQLSLFIETNASEIIAMLKGVDINTLTPMEALNLLYELREKAKREN